MNLVEKLLQVDRNATKRKREGTYNSYRLKEMVGDGEIRIREISPRKRNKYVGMAMTKSGQIDYDKIYDANLLAVVEGVIEPDLRNKDLMEHFGAATPKDLAEIIFRQEIEDIADAITGLSDAPEDSEETIKN